MPGTAPPAGHSSAAGAAPGRLETVRLFVNTLDIELGTDELSTPESLMSWLATHGLLPAAGTQDPSSSPAPAPAGEADVRQAVALREALRGVLLSHLGTASHAGAAAARGRGRPGPDAEPAAEAPDASYAPDAPDAPDASHAADAPDTLRAPGAAVGAPAAELRRIAGFLRARLEVSDDGQVAAAPAGTGPPAALARILLIAAEAAVTGTWPRLKVCSADDCRWAFYDRSPTRNGCWCSMAVCGSRAKSRAYRQRAAARQ